MKLLSLALILFASVASASAIDFTPRYAESVQDGFPVKRLYFSDKEQRIYLTIPNGWSVSGNSQRGALTPPNFAQASVILENSRLNGQVPFDDKGLEIYRKAAYDLIPAGATEVEVAFERTNEIQLNGWSSFEMGFNYQAYGQSLSRSILFINLDREKQIRFRVEALKENFEKLYPQARGTLGSWFAPSPELESALQRLATQH